MATTEATTQPTEAGRLEALEAKQAQQAAELERLRQGDPATKAMAASMRAPQPSPVIQRQIDAQHAAARARQAAVEAQAEAAEMDRRVHQPELARHAQELQAFDARIVKAAEALAKAERAHVELCAQRTHHAANPPWTPPSPFPASVPLFSDERRRLRDEEQTARRRGLRSRVR
jgi:hypothetical protein